MTEHVKVAGMRLGRRPASNKPALRLRSILTGVVPSHPFTVRRTDDVPDWDIRGNDRFGVCGPVAVANARALTTTVLAGIEQYPNLPAVYDLYERSGNPGFPNDDNGVDLQTMLKEVARNGIRAVDITTAPVRAVAFAKVDITNLDEVRAAIAIFGCLILGVNLREAQQRQTVWEYTRGSPPWGGHAVLAADYTSLAGRGQPDIGFVTWGAVLQVTDEFWRGQTDEAWVVIWPEHFGSTSFHEGIDVVALANAYYDLTGRVLPVPAPQPPPRPVPVPPAPPNRPTRYPWWQRFWRWLTEYLREPGR